MKAVKEIIIKKNISYLTYGDKKWNRHTLESLQEYYIHNTKLNTGA